jgi:16S rRNA (cytosine967-C5)-methyltransferase
VTGARLLAWQVLMAVEAGGFASDLLEERSRGLDPREAALATELVMGVLRRRAQLDWLLGKSSSRPVAGLDREVLTVLRLGAYQLRFLDRIPGHAAVSESVALVRRARKLSAAGYVNAVLRRLPGLPATWPTRQTRLSLPEWLCARWQARWGADAVERIGAACLEPPPIFVRVPPGVEPGPGLAPAPGLPPGCYQAESAAAAAGFRRMDAGSQRIVPLLGLAPGQRFLDLCAAPGNKTAQALESGVRAVACDVSRQRLGGLLVTGVARVQLDAAAPLPFGRVFDRILVDAPCSGTGTLARNPEIRWRVQQEDLQRHAKRQKQILTQALECLAPGGHLVYATCSLEPEENEEVVNAVAPALLRQWHEWLPGQAPGDGFQAAVLCVG